MKFGQKIFFGQKIKILDKFKPDNNLTIFLFDNVKTYLRAKIGRKWVRIQPMRSRVKSMRNVEEERNRRNHNCEGELVELRAVDAEL